MNVCVDFNCMKDCINPASYGEICVRCNACGRFDKASQNECALQLYKEQLEENQSFDGWDDEPKIKAIQERNVKANIESLTALIHDLEGKS